MACDLIKETDEDNYNLVTKEEALKYGIKNGNNFVSWSGIYIHTHIHTYIMLF